MRVTFLTFGAFAYALVLSCQHPAAPKVGADPTIRHEVLPEVAQQNMEDYKSLLYVDQTLEELAAIRNPDAPPDGLGSAREHVRAGRPEEAKKALRKVLTDPDAEIRQKLIAWKALRDLGERPPPESRDEVRGVVLEVPVDGWTDTLAAYSDGRARYVNGMRGAIIWEVTDHWRIGPLVANLLRAAGPLAKKSRAVERHLPPAAGVFRATALTFGGLRVAEAGSLAAAERDPAMKAVSDAGAQLFFALLEEDQKRPQKP